MGDKTADNNNSENESMKTNESMKNRVMGRQGATKISQEDLENVSGGVIGGTRIITGPVNFQHADVNID